MKKVTIWIKKCEKDCNFCILKCLKRLQFEPVRSEDPYKLMCVQGVQRQDVIQCVQAGILYKQSINHTELYIHNFLYLIMCSSLYN